MHYQNIPIHLHQQVQCLLTELMNFTIKPNHCIYCQHNKLYSHDTKRHAYRCCRCHKVFTPASGTVFARLTPYEWLPIITQRRLNGQSNCSISHDFWLNSTKKIKTRVKAIESFMQQRFPQLFIWYNDFMYRPKHDTPELVITQIRHLKDWVNSLIHTHTPNCLYCGYDKTIKVTTSYTRFRCRHCWRYFNILKGTGLERLQHQPKWFLFLDMLINGATNIAIKEQLNMTMQSVSHARQVWLKIMDKQQLWALADWVRRT